MAKLTVRQDNYGRWRWLLTGREAARPDVAGAVAFEDRLEALADGREVWGGEVSFVVMDGVSEGAGTVPALPVVDRVAELDAAGFDPPDVLMT